MASTAATRSSATTTKRVNSVRARPSRCAEVSSQAATTAALPTSGSWPGTTHRTSSCRCSKASAKRCPLKASAISRACMPDSLVPGRGATFPEGRYAGTTADGADNDRVTGMDDTGVHWLDADQQRDWRALVLG